MRRPPAAATILTVLGFSLLVSLGVWQLKRLAWKTDLLARIDALKTAPPRPIDGVLSRLASGADEGYVRVKAPCPDIERTPVLRLYGVVNGQAGYRMIAACALASGPYRSLLVDRGFVAGTQTPPAPPPGPRLDQPIVGVLRTGGERTFVTPKNQPGQNLWYWRDLPAMASALGANRPAPMFLALERPAPKGPGPIPAALPTNIPNNHLGYAITWFGLAAALAGVYLAMLFGKRRR